MLGKLRSIIENNNVSNKEAVISCPSYYTDSERKALLDACKIAEFTCVRLYNESAAITLSYGLFRKAELDALTPRHVVFLDFGHKYDPKYNIKEPKKKAYNFLFNTCYCILILGFGYCIWIMMC